MYCKQSSPLFLLVLLAVALSLASCIHDPDWEKNQDKNQTMLVSSVILSVEDSIQARGYYVDESRRETTLRPSPYMHEVVWTAKYSSDFGRSETTQLHVRKQTNRGTAYVICGAGVYINEQRYSMYCWCNPADFDSEYWSKLPPAPCSAEKLVELLLEQYPDYLIEINDTLEHDFNITLGFSNDSERPRLTLTE